MDSKISAVLNLLADGEWHFTDWLTGVLEFVGGEMENILWFLEEFGFAIVDSNGGRVKISEEFRRLPEVSNI